VDEIHKAGKEVFAWTVNEAQLLLRFAEWGVDALISDDTALLAATFRQNSKS
jgi:Glycerophosphoryl diester phosphodiesterase